MKNPSARQGRDTQGKMSTHRKWPFRLQLLAGLIAYFSLWNLVRLITSLDWFGALETYVPRPGPVYIGITGALWMLVGLFLLWCMWRGRRRTWVIILIASGLYAAWFWLDRLIVQPETRANWPFTLAITLLLLAFIAAVLLDRRNQSILEREAYEREP